MMTVFMFGATILNSIIPIIETCYDPKLGEESETIISLRASALSENGEAFTLPLHQSTQQDNLTSSSVSNTPRKKREFGFKDLSKIDIRCWLAVMILNLNTQLYYQFMNIITIFFVKRFGYTYSEAKDLVAIIPLSTAIFIPFVSLFIFYVGKKGIF